MSHLSAEEINVVGGNLTRNEFGMQLEEIEVELKSALADPLPRLFWNGEAKKRWLEERRRYLANSIPDRPSRNDAGGPGLIGMNLASYVLRSGEDYDSNLKDFDERVQQHLGICRDRLFENVLAELYEQDANGLQFIVRNKSQETLDSVRMVAEFDGTGLQVMDGAPSRRGMPNAPEWPSVQEKWLASMPTIDPAIYSVGALRPVNNSVIRSEVQTDGPLVQIHYTLGDIGPLQKMRTPDDVAIVAGPDVEAFTSVAVRLTCHAKNRRGVATEDVVVQISRKGYFPEYLVSPRY